MIFTDQAIKYKNPLSSEHNEGKSIQYQPENVTQNYHKRELCFSRTQRRN